MSYTTTWWTSAVGRTDSRPSCPPPISLKQSQQNMNTRSRYTPLKRGVSCTSKSDANQTQSEVPGTDVKGSSTTDDGAKLEKTKGKVNISCLHLRAVLSRKGRGASARLIQCWGPFTCSSFPLFTFSFLSLALPIFFFCPSLSFLPE